MVALLASSAVPEQICILSEASALWRTLLLDAVLLAGPLLLVLQSGTVGCVVVH